MVTLSVLENLRIALDGRLKTWQKILYFLISNRLKSLKSSIDGFRLKLEYDEVYEKQNDLEVKTACESVLANRTKIDFRTYLKMPIVIHAANSKRKTNYIYLQVWSSKCIQEIQTSKFNNFQVATGYFKRKIFLNCSDCSVRLFDFVIRLCTYGDTFQVIRNYTFAMIRALE